MPFTAQELANIYNSHLDYFFGKGQVFTQAIQQKPMLAAFDRLAGTFPGGKGEISLAIKAGGAGGSLQGYSHDDPVSYYNPATTQRVAYSWKEMFLGIGVTHTELKHDGITVTEEGADQSTSNKDGREEHALANMLDEKVADMNEDYAKSMDSLVHEDGSGDTKAIAGVKSFLLDNPALGSTGGKSRATSWWRNRAATAAANSASTGFASISSSPTNGGVLLQFLQKERRQLSRFAQGGVTHRCFAGSDFIDAMEKELRANGSYADNSFRERRNVDGSLPTEQSVPFGNWSFVYDPTLDDMGEQKRAYIIDMRRIKLMYMTGEKMKRANPARPHDRFVMYRGVTTTAVMCAQQLNTSGVYDIA